MSHEFGRLPSVPPDEAAARTFLTKHEWPQGFQTLLMEQCANNIPVRFFVCDDSGSMYQTDGMHLVTNSSGISKPMSCSRWAELTESLLFHSELSHVAQAPSEFRLLNSLGPKFIGDNDLDPDRQNFRAITKVFESGSPQGATPLCKHINQIVHYIKHHESTLRESGQAVSIIICTDGQSSDGDVTAAMKPLKDLPCMVVVRLCTNKDDIVAYWDHVEKDLEMELDIIDDFFGEGEGVEGFNSWLNYGMPLQRLREFGVRVKELDMIDERQLTTQQMVKFLSILFNTPVSKIPNPEFDWKEFDNWVVAENAKLPPTYNPKSQEVEEWINISKLRECYRPANDSSGGSAAMGCCSIQ